MNVRKQYVGFRVAVGLLAMVVILFVFVVARRHSVVGYVGLELPRLVAHTIQQLFLFVSYQGMTIALIWALFFKSSYVRFTALLVLLALLTLFPLYMYLHSIGQPGQSTIMIAIRQLVFNPGLMLILVPALYYQYWAGHN